MSDMIGRQAAIDELKRYFEHINRLKKNGLNNAERAICEDVQGVIQFAPSAQPEQRWIPCSERLPEKNGRYLATRGLKACNSIWNRVYIVNYSDLMGIRKEKFFWQGNVGKSDFEEITDIIAWQPLPEPYKESKE